MRPRFPLALTVMMVVLGAGTMTVAASAFGEEHNKLEMAAAAKVTIDEAIKTASEKLAGKIIGAFCVEGRHGLACEVIATIILPWVKKKKLCRVVTACSWCAYDRVIAI